VGLLWGCGGDPPVDSSTPSSHHALQDASLAIDGAASGDLAGTAVASAGDFDGDGRGDLWIGAPGTDGAEEDAGAASLLLGRSGVTWTSARPTSW